LYLNLLKISICCVLDLFWKVSLRLRIRPKNRKALQLRAFWAGASPLLRWSCRRPDPRREAARLRCPRSAAGCPA
jgi:hypothetical protein